MHMQSFYFSSSKFFFLSRWQTFIIENELAMETHSDNSTISFDQIMERGNEPSIKGMQENVSIFCFTVYFDDQRGFPHIITSHLGVTNIFKGGLIIETRNSIPTELPLEFRGEII